jgi:hypothetical protein
MATEFRLRVSRVVGPNGQIGKETVKEVTGLPLTDRAQAENAANALLAGPDVVQVVVQTREAPDWVDDTTVGVVPPRPTRCETCGQPLPP